MSSSVYGKKGGGCMSNQLRYSWKITGWKHKKHIIYNHIIIYDWCSTCRYWVMQENSNGMAFHCRIAPGVCCWWDVVWKLSLICCLTCRAMLSGIWNRSIPTINTMGIKKMKRVDSGWTWCGTSTAHPFLPLPRKNLQLFFKSSVVGSSASFIV